MNKKCFRGVLPHKNPAEILHLGDDTRPQPSVKIRERNHKIALDSTPHPPYSPDLAISHFHIFRPFRLNFCEAELAENASCGLLGVMMYLNEEH